MHMTAHTERQCAEIIGRGSTYTGATVRRRILNNDGLRKAEHAVEYSNRLRIHRLPLPTSGLHNAYTDAQWALETNLMHHTHGTSRAHRARMVCMA